MDQVWRICRASFKTSTLLLEAVSLVLKKKCVSDAFSHLPLCNPININWVNWVSLAHSDLQLRFKETQAPKRHKYRFAWSYTAYYVVGNSIVKQRFAWKETLLKQFHTFPFFHSTNYWRGKWASISRPSIIALINFSGIKQVR